MPRYSDDILSSDLFTEDFDPMDPFAEGFAADLPDAALALGIARGARPDRSGWAE